MQRNQNLLHYCISLILFPLGVSLMPSASLPHKVISVQCQSYATKMHYLVTPLLKNYLLTLSSILTSLYWYAENIWKPDTQRIKHLKQLLRLQPLHSPAFFLPLPDFYTSMFLIVPTPSHRSCGLTATAGGREGEKARRKVDGNVD